MKRLKSILAVALVACGIGAAAPSMASAHQGDWWTQYNVTLDRARYHCQQINCTNIYYITSGVYSEHSRSFKWTLRRSSGCTRDYYYYIGDNYHVWYWFYANVGPYC